jgi:hypothetical protein
MKKLAMFAVAAAALVLAAGKVEASGNLVLNISGSVQYQVTNSATVGKTKTQSFNNATIYNLISNAVANATNGIATNLPAKGIIAYDPEGYDGMNTGLFYVTDKTNGFYYPLSGQDTNSQYYSFIELDSYVVINDGAFDLGFDNPFDGSASYTLNASGNGSLSGKDTALLYIHDNPYTYDAADSPDNYYSANNTFYGQEYNGQVLEIQGILTINLSYKADSVNSGSISLSGAGNALLNGNNYDASVISGHASLK